VVDTVMEEVDTVMVVDTADKQDILRLSI